MALSEERIGQIARMALVAKATREGIHLKPKEIKRQVKTAAKELGVPTHEVAEVVLLCLKEIFQKTISELEAMIEEPSKPS